MTDLPESLRLLASLRQLSEHEFAQLLRDRQVPARGIHDPIDLADWLHRDEHIRAAMARLSWPVLRGLRRGEPDALARAAELQLAVANGDGVALLPAAAVALHELLPRLPELTAQAESLPGAAESARAAAQLANDALWLLDAWRPPVQQHRGGVRLSAVEVRRLAGELHCSPELAGQIAGWLAAAGLTAPLDDRWAATEAGREFPTTPVVDRWQTLAGAWLDALPLTEVLERPWRGPDGASAEPEHPAVFLGMADQLRGDLTELGALALHGDLQGAAAVLADSLTPPVTTVYIQPDLTIVAPGPISGADDAELRSFAELERRGTASQYRLTPQSVERALLTGRSPAELRAQLERLSAGSIPQPVLYLLDTAADRFGRVRVRATLDDLGRVTARIRTRDAQLLDALRVDRALGALALRPAADGLVSPASPDLALSVLASAHYPAALEDDHGSILPMRAADPAPPWQPAFSSSVAQAAAELAAKVDAAPAADDHASWVRRRLELARRDRAELRLEIALGGNRTTRLDVIPLAVSESRLRARDAEAEVERTVPLRAIVAVEGTRVPPETDANYT